MEISTTCPIVQEPQRPPEQQVTHQGNWGGRGKGWNPSQNAFTPNSFGKGMSTFKGAVWNNNFGKGKGNFDGKGTWQTQNVWNNAPDFQRKSQGKGAGKGKGENGNTAQGRGSFHKPNVDGAVQNSLNVV